MVMGMAWFLGLLVILRVCQYRRCYCPGPAARLWWVPPPLPSRSPEFGFSTREDCEISPGHHGYCLFVNVSRPARDLDANIPRKVLSGGISSYHELSVCPFPRYFQLPQTAKSSTGKAIV